mgnify:CR=1 FL=1
MKTTAKRIFYALVLIGTIIAIVIGFQAYKLYQLKVVTIDAELKEISGIEFDKYQRLWAINDGGDGPYIYHVQRDGSIKRKIAISNAINNDWEDMTQNDFGHFFIGDFGNNEKKRDWLTIYKIENPIDIKTDETEAEIIKFAYPTSLPEEAGEGKNFDVEAFVYYKRKLYLFTKNRTQPFDGQTHILTIGDHASNYQANYVSSFTSCTSFKMSCWITSAALSPDRKKLVLLDSSRLWLFENWQGDDFFSGDAYRINLGAITQKESVTFFDDNTVVFTDEEFKQIGRNAYVVKLDQIEKTLVYSRRDKTKAAEADTSPTKP